MAYVQLDNIQRNALRRYRSCVRERGEDDEVTMEAYLMCIEAGIPEDSVRLERPLQPRTDEV